MNILIWLNFIVNILIIIFLIRKFFLYNLSLGWDKTFWAEYKLGIEVWFNDIIHGTGTRILYIPVNSKTKLEKRDEEYFKKTHGKIDKSKNMV
jgi:hypothetical protein